MSTDTAVAPGPNAAGVRWNLDAVYPSIAAAREGASRLGVEAESFATRYREHVSELTVAELLAATDEFARLADQRSRLGYYASLRMSTDSLLQENIDLEAEVERISIEVAGHTRFFLLEWQQMDPEDAAVLSAAPELHRYRHLLENLTEHARHRLTEAEENIVDQLSPTLASWQQLFRETVSNVEIPLDDGDGERMMTLDEALALVRVEDRSLRSRALLATYGALEPHTSVLARCYDSLVGHRLTMDALRGFASPMTETNMDNDLSDAVVDSMIDQVSDHFPLARRWFALKARMLGLDRFTLADMYAPVGTSGTVPFATGRELLRAAMERFSPDVWQILDDAFTGGHIDAEPRPGKEGGAYCAPVATDCPPFVLMNYTDMLDDAHVLGHELGHLLHFALAAREQTSLTFETGMGMAEVPSTFNELLMFDADMERETDPERQRTLVAQMIDANLATLFRQTTLARFERGAYALRSEQQTLSAERLGDIWMRENAAYFGDAVEMPDSYRVGWCYIPHFIYTRFYTYSYSFAQLTSLTLYARYREMGQEFVPLYLAMLTAGASQSPEQLLQPLGIDLSDPRWVEPGFAELERLIALAEQLEQTASTAGADS